jgi:hypothetical protein
MYIDNARTLKTILSQLSDTETFSEERDQLLANEQHRSFRFVLRFADADNSFGYPTNHPLHNGYTVNGKLTGSNHQVRVSLAPRTNSFIESLQAGDTLEVVASLQRWDPAYNVVEMESNLENLVSPESTPLTDHNNSAVDTSVTVGEVLSQPIPVKEKPATVNALNNRQQTDGPVKNASTGRSLTRWFTFLGCLGCVVTVSLIFAYSSSAAGWGETPAKLIYYRAKNRRLFITYAYTVDKTKYQRTEPADESHGAAGNYFWVVYQRDNPRSAEVSQRHHYDNLITIFTVGPLLLIFLVGGWIVVIQILRAPHINRLPSTSS